MFFGTPHRGGNGVGPGKIAARIARYLTGSSSNDILDTLEKDSIFSKQMADLFRSQLEDYFVVSFFETKRRRIQKYGIGFGAVRASHNLPAHGSRSALRLSYQKNRRHLVSPTKEKYSFKWMPIIHRCVSSSATIVDLHRSLTISGSWQKRQCHIRTHLYEVEGGL